jgi:hypothetical protein
MAMIENPYASPQSATVADIQIVPRLTATRMLAVLLVGLGGGAVLGTLTNSVNGALSPQYFRDVMGWRGSDIWISSSHWSSPCGASTNELRWKNPLNPHSPRGNSTNAICHDRH